jgi:hypothetical protein
MGVTAGDTLLDEVLENPTRKDFNKHVNVAHEVKYMWTLEEFTRDLIKPTCDSSKINNPAYLGKIYSIIIIGEDVSCHREICSARIYRPKQHRKLS